MNPSLLAQYVKAVCGAIVAAGGAAATAAADGHISVAEGCLIAVTFFGTLGGVSAVKNTLSAKQLLAQPGYSPATAHVAMPLDHADAVRGGYIDPGYAADLEQRAAAAQLVLTPGNDVLTALAEKASRSKTWTTPTAWAEHALEQAVKDR